ncbi:MAG TPA: hypothetical protein VFK30_13180 [Anaerolineae bacterium]|nr:hypothetical protein [Anaerolineae bacterium]
MSSFLQDAINSALQARREHEARLMNMDNVVATGVGFKIAGTTQTTEPSVIVSVTKKLPLEQLSAAALVPKTVNNVKTDVIETGKLVAFQDPTQKMRPAQPGVSLGHYQITAGTFGCLVQRGGQIYILSNNHVLANVNDAQIGDPIWQPGKYDGGTSADQIAALEQFFSIAFDGEPVPTPPPNDQPGCAPFAALLSVFAPKAAEVPAPNQAGSNTIDCAIAKPVNPGIVSATILNIGLPIGTGSATLGLAVQKSGRTTGYTTGQITQIDVTAVVDYDGKSATFRNQLLAGAMSAGGDSGSAVLDMNKRVVALLFAGSSTTTLMNPIQPVLDALQVQLVTG